MAPRTRRAQKAAMMNQAEGGLDEGNISLEHGTGPNVSNRVVGQDVINVINHQANLRGGFKTLVSGITNITQSQWETHLFLLQKQSW